VGGKVFELRIPVFVYFPGEATARTAALGDLHQAYDGLVDLSAKPNATPADFEAVLGKLDSALTKLEAIHPPAISPPVTATASTQTTVPPGAPAAAKSS
jgi:hypothetical protein